MTTPERDGAAVRIPPPLVYLAAVIVGWLVQRYGYAVPIGLPRGARIGAAIVVALLGVGVIGAAFGLFKRTGQDPKPWLSTPEIIATGIYRFTRNPMYVGMGLIQIALGIGLANAWILGLVLVSIVVVYLTAVRHEEAYLERKFGEEYLAYKRSVRRWM